MIFSQQLELRPLFEKETSTYTYILFDNKTLEAIIIDPVKETFQRDCRVIEELSLKLKWVFETHIHADHITSAHQFSETFNIPIGVSESGKVKHERVEFLRDNQEVTINDNFKIRCILTPGHTDCSACFHVENLLFTGDTLFIRGCGRTDFQQGSNEDLFESVRSKLFTLSDETVVLPGHDYKGELFSSIKEEKQHNPRLKLSNSFEDFSAIMNSLNLSYPKKIDVALPANIVCGRE